MQLEDNPPDNQDPLKLVVDNIRLNENSLINMSFFRQ